MTTPLPISPPAPTPSGIRTCVAILSTLVILITLATFVASIAIPARPLWTLIGFECITLLAAGFGIGAAMGKFADGPGMALACVSGTIFVSSVLGYLGATGQIGDYKLQYWLIAHLLIALAIGLLGAWTILRRTPGAWLIALRGTTYTMAAIGFTGVLMAFDGHMRPTGSSTRLVAHALFSTFAIIPIPLCIVFAIGTLFSKPSDETMPRWMRLLGQLSIPLTAIPLLILTKGNIATALTGVSEVARLSLLGLLAIALTGAICAGVHLIVTAFASCATPADDLPASVGLTPTPGATLS